MYRYWIFVSLILLAACQSAPQTTSVPPPQPPAQPLPPAPPHPSVSPYPPAQEDVTKRGDYVAGGLYAPHIQDRAPGDIPDVDAIPEPAVIALPRSTYGNRSPYQVLGKSYHVLDDATGFVETGVASYYGSKFHGRRTSNQEIYDMYAFTAAHKSLPLPSFARVTNLENGKSVVVRVNDRGPFHSGRIIDLSYAAAVKIGIDRAGTGQVEVRALTADTQSSPMDHWLAARIAETTTTKHIALGSGIAQSSKPSSLLPDLHLQVGAFSLRSNAENALARLHAAGISLAALHDDIQDGRPLWRLRIPVTALNVAQISARITRLGFGAPRIVQQ